MDITDEIGFSNLKTSALIKTTPWRVESECRVIVADPPVSGDEPRIVNDRIYFGGQLTGIVFGERTTREHIDEILALLDPTDHPPLYVARGHIPFREVAVFELLRPIAKLSPAPSPLLQFLESKDLHFERFVTHHKQAWPIELLRSRPSYCRISHIRRHSVFGHKLV